jgi:hypothetical protein
MESAIITFIEVYNYFGMIQGVSQKTALEFG